VYNAFLMTRYGFETQPLRETPGRKKGKQGNPPETGEHTDWGSLADTNSILTNTLFKISTISLKQNYGILESETERWSTELVNGRIPTVIEEEVEDGKKIKKTRKFADIKEFDAYIIARIIAFKKMKIAEGK